MFNKQQKNTKKTILISLIFTLTLLNISKTEEVKMIHESIHDKFMSNKQITEISNPPRYLNEQAEFRPFRILIDWRYTEAWVEKLPSSDKAQIKPKIDYMKSVFLTVNNYFAKRFQVNTRETMTLPKGLNCHGSKVASDLLGKPIEQDLVITIQPHNAVTGWFAAAGACAKDSSTNRPVAGAILLNFHHIHVSEVNRYYLPGVFIHEMMHVIGFSGFFMEIQGLLKEITIGNAKRWAVTSAAVVNHAKEYFSCNEIEGVPLENGGGSGSAGSHWEKTMFPAEVMNPQVAYPVRISMLTIKLLEDLGWYKGINAHQNYTYLKGDGCHTIKGGECNSSKSDEFCSAADFGHDHCYPNKMGKGYCGKSSTFMGSCGLVMPGHNTLCTVENSLNHKKFNFESYGPHSRCVMTEKNKGNYDAACLRMRCTKDKIEIQFGSEVHTCQGSGPQTVNTTSYKGRVDCPTFSEMCTEVLEKRCPMDCYGQGLCMANATCQCLGGFSGDDCNKGLPKEEDPFVTEYDIRKGKDGEDEKEEEEEEDDDEKEDEEKEKEDEDEEKKEEEDEEEREKTPAAKKLEKKIESLQTSKDFWTVDILKYTYKLQVYNLCLAMRQDRQKGCANKKKWAEKGIIKSESKVAGKSEKIAAAEAKLAALLTTNQREMRNHEQEELDFIRNAQRIQVYMEFITSKRTKIETYLMTWERYIEHYKKLIEMYKNQPEDNGSKMVAWLEKVLLRYEMYMEYYKELISLIDREITESGDQDNVGFVVTSIDGDQIDQEIEEEKNGEINANADSNLSIVMAYEGN